MVNEQLDDILQACLEGFAQGETLDVCLQHYPEHADALLPLLQAATQVRQMPRPTRTPAAIEHGRAQLRTAVQAARLKKQRRPRQPHFTVYGAAFALLLCIVFSLTTIQSASALPGDRLYDWKRTSERVRYSIAWSPADRARVSLWAAQRRLAEIKALLNRGRIDHELLAALAMENARCWNQITAVQGREQAALVIELRRTAQAQAQMLSAAAQQTTGMTQTLLVLSAQKSAAADHPLMTPTPLPMPTASAQPAMLTPEVGTPTQDASQPLSSVLSPTSQPALVPPAGEQATAPPTPFLSTTTPLPTTYGSPTDKPVLPDRPAPTVSVTATRQPASGASPTTTPQSTPSSKPTAIGLPVSTSTAYPTPSHSVPSPSPPKGTATNTLSPTLVHTSTPYPGPPKGTATNTPSPTLVHTSTPSPGPPKGTATGVPSSTPSRTAPYPSPMR